MKQGISILHSEMFMYLLDFLIVLFQLSSQLKKNCNVHFSRDDCLVWDQVSGKILTKGPKVGKLFPLHFLIASCLSLACVIVNTQNEVWHKCLGHPNSIVLSHMLNFGLLGNKEQVSKNLSFDCSVCKLCKSKTLSFSSHGSCAEKCFDIVHSDVWGISPVISHARYKYFVTFINDFSYDTWVYFLRSKSKVLFVFQTFITYVETQFSTSLKILRSDSSGEYVSHKFHDFLHHKELSLRALVLITLSKMGWLNERIDISWTLFAPYFLSPLFLLNSRLRHYLLQFT